MVGTKVPTIYFVCLFFNSDYKMKNRYYHYSKEKFTQLETKAYRNGERKFIVNDIENLPYGNHISLFVERPPLDIIGKLFHNHPFWYNGNEIYEYVIELKTLPDKLTWTMEETPHKNSFYEKYRQINGDVRTDEEIDLFWNELNKERVKLGEAGFNKASMEKCSDKYRTKTRRFYIDAGREFHDAKQYAPNVPHLMVYPELGFLLISSTREVVIGETKRLTDLF